MAAPSRIFVRNLPPSLTEPEFKTHFSNSAPVTDTKLISHRRIGYVGYKTPEAAAKAVKYFNKSFIRMSRIGVELARGLTERNALSVEHPGNAPNGNDSSGAGERGQQQERPAKRVKIDEGDQENAKLKEFLDVMQSSKTSRTWENDALDARRPEAIVEPAVTTQAGQSDDEYETVPKKKRAERQRPEDTEKPPDVAKDPESQDAVAEGNQDHLDRSNNLNPSADIEVAATTDADWLRSRTSRLLDLRDDDEPDGYAQAEASPLSETQTLQANTDTLDNIDTVSQEASPTTPADRDGDIERDGNEPLAQATRDDTARLFVRNLSYNTTEDELQSYFGDFGAIEEVHVPLDPRSKANKGFAYIQYDSVDAASAARQELDGKPFQGRLLHILAAESKRERMLDDYAISKLPHKKQQEIRRKQEAGSASYKWNSLYMNPDAVVSSISDRLGVSKADILDPTSASAAVKQAHAEINIIQETKAYLSANGVNVDAFKKLDGAHRKDLSDRVIIVRNFPYGTTPEDIRELFETHGTLTKLLMPPAGTIAIVEMEQPGQTRAALGSLAFRKFKDSVLHLGKAPKSIFSEASESSRMAPSSAKDSKLSVQDLIDKAAEPDAATSSTLFISNLNFSTTSTELRDLFRTLKGFMSARVKTKRDPKRPGEVLSMGFGFVEFQSKEDAHIARKTMDGEILDGHDLRIKESHKGLDAAEERRKEDIAKKNAGRRTKIIVKNLPFEATKHDVQQLFGPYAKSRSVRVPRKFDSSTRGFAFVDFVTAREAENAMEALAGAHLLGRRLNLEFTADETVDPEEEIEKMSRKVGTQADKVALQRLTGSGRKKFSINKEGEDDIME